jgi:hypothetical protein
MSIKIKFCGERISNDECVTCISKDYCEEYSNYYKVIATSKCTDEESAMYLGTNEVLLKNYINCLNTIYTYKLIKISKQEYKSLLKEIQEQGFFHVIK